MAMEFQEWFKSYEIELNKEFANDNGQEFIAFCKRKHKEEGEK